MFGEGLYIWAKHLLMMFAIAKEYSDPVPSMLITAFTFLNDSQFLVLALGVCVFNMHIINNEN